MRLSGIGSRLGLAALLFLAPMAFLLWALLAAHAKDIDFARSELRGVDVLRALTPAQAILARSTLGEPGLDPSRVADQIAAAGTILPSLRDPATAAADAARAAGDPARLGHARDALKTLIGAAGDSSNLILDPVLDSYYTTDVVLSRLPDALDRVADLAAAPRNDEAARTAFFINLGGLKAAADGMDDSVASAIAGNPDGGTRVALGAPAAVVSKALHAYIADVEAAPLDPARATATLAALADFAATAQAELARLLKLRIRTLHRTEAIEVGGGFALFMLSALVVSAIVGRAVIRPLGGLARAMGRLAAGDLHVDVPAHHAASNEVGALARAMAVFKANAAAARAAELVRAAEQEEKLRRQCALTALARDFSAAVRARLTDLTEAAASLNTTALALSAQADQTKGQTGGVAEGAESALRSAQTVAAATEQLTATSSEIGRQARVAAEQTMSAATQSAEAREVLRGLNEAASAISDVVELIRSIASQTNLLALNATIEAARAGDAGRGFAVVAGEVKALALQTARAVDAVQARVEAIGAGSAAAGTAIDQIAAMVGEISVVASSIASAITEQGQATSEITRAVQESADSSRSVAASVNELRSGVGVAQHASESLTDASASMAERTDELSAEVARFVAAMGGASERRRFERRRSDAPVVLHLPDGRREPARLVDIGLGGCSIASAIHPDAGEEIGIAVNGKVVQARSVGGADGVVRFQFCADAQGKPPQLEGLLAA